MAYSKEVMRRARQRLAEAKADRESENQQHLAEAYARVPRLREIDRQLREIMVLAARAAFTQGGDATELMEQAKEQSLGLQAERNQLVSRYFEEGYLDDSPICSRCGGQGYVGSTMCECLTELCRQEQRKELSLLSGGKETFNQFRLEYYSDQIDGNYGASPRAIMERTLRTCRQYAQNFTPNSENLLFSGDTGLGKTFLSACIARAVADSGYSVAYDSAGHLFANMERAKFGGDEEARELIEKYSRCDLLIIDDLGTEMPGQFTNSALYTLINDRLLERKSTIISTNLTTEDISRRYNSQIASRLRGSYVRVPFVGEDIRVQKNRGL